jgi:cyclin-dependent kinase 10
MMTSPGGIGMCRPVSTFHKLGRIGEGTYGTVYCATDRFSGEKVALKRVIMHGESAEGFPVTSLREISVLRLASGRNHCVKLLDVAVNDRRDGVFLVFEYCEHDLATLLTNLPHAFSESEIKTLTMHLLSALDFLHSHYIIHRDIKMSNLLYNNRGQLKLADFGLARPFTILRGPENLSSKRNGHLIADPMTARVVTLWYRAPELLLLPTADSSKWSYSTAVDIWACGCVSAELLRGGKPLLPGSDEIDQVYCHICAHLS